MTTVSLGPFEFERGGSVPDLEVAYETWGEYTGDNAVLVCHALTGSHRVTCPSASPARRATREADQATGWWDGVVGPGKFIDTREQFVVCANVPGSCYGTTGPASTNPETGEPYGSAFPAVTVGDWVRAQRRLIDRLGIDVLHGVVGGSVGGMNVLEWAKRYPERVERVAPVATAARLDPQLLGLSAIARRAIASDPAWRGGDYYPDHPDDGLALARQLGHVTYLSKESMERKFGRRAAACSPRGFAPDGNGDGNTYREVESYLDYQAERFVERFDANSYLRLTSAMEEYDLADGCASNADALSGFHGEALVLSVSGDWHFTTEQAEALAGAFRDAGCSVTHRVVDSDHGHDAFLARPDQVGPPLRGFFGRDAQFAPVHASLFAH